MVFPEDTRKKALYLLDPLLELLLVSLLFCLVRDENAARPSTRLRELERDLRLSFGAPLGAGFFFIVSITKVRKPAAHELSSQ